MLDADQESRQGPAPAPDLGCRTRSLLDEEGLAAARGGEVGYVHSRDPSSSLDGPGLRYVLWTTGCMMRCQYCHNPDTWRVANGRRTTLEETLRDIGRFERFLRAARGGVTVSGGEPLVQAPFVLKLLRGVRERGLHAALDTNGYLGDRMTDEDLHNVDLFLLDLKSYKPGLHRSVTGVEVDPILRFARRLKEHGRPAWIRFVLVPGLTDDPENVEGLAGFVAELDNVQRVEVLPFHQMGRFKWERLGIRYPMQDTEPPTPELTEETRERFRRHGLPVA